MSETKLSYTKMYIAMTPLQLRCRIDRTFGKQKGWLSALLYCDTTNDAVYELRRQIPDSTRAMIGVTKYYEGTEAAFE